MHACSETRAILTTAQRRMPLTQAVALVDVRLVGRAEANDARSCSPCRFVGDTCTKKASPETESGWK